MQHLNVNTADPWQLMVLLDLSREETEALLLTRPFNTPESFWAALPQRLATTHPALDINKLDINQQTPGSLIKAAGIAPDLALKIVLGRPYFFDSQWSRVLAGTPAFAQLNPYFTVPELKFTDKVSGTAVTLTADPSRIMVEKTDSESAQTVRDTMGLKSRFPKAHSATYEVFDIPDTEDATDVVGKIEQGQHTKVVPAYQDANSKTRFLHPRLCVVQFVDGTTQATETSIIAQFGLVITLQHRTPGLFTLEVRDAATNPAALVTAINQLNQRPEVKFAEPNFLGFDDLEAVSAAATTVSATQDKALAWNLELVHASEAWRTTVGSPDVLIAIIDTGVQMDHPCLQGGVATIGDGESWNFADSGNARPDDDDGHGTFIAGLLVGNGTLGLQGICPGSRILPLKVPLTGEDNSYAGRRDGILFALSKVKPNERLIMNISWKTTGDVGLIRDAIATAVAKGAIVVASAGNYPDSPNEAHFPSDYSGVISVASVGPDKHRASYSYYGDSVTLAAPGGASDQSGGAIQSAALGGALTTNYGTSFAAPHVAGAAALLLSAMPSFTATQVRADLCSTAATLADTGIGKGLVDFGAALNQARQAEVGPTAPSSPVSSFGLQLINTATADELVARFGLLPFTAMLLVAKRPYAKLEDIHQVLGLTDLQFAAIASVSS